jgi:uncharacterized protein YdiU (UPF0061 family)
MEHSMVTGKTAKGGWRLEHSYAQLPEMFHRKSMPVPVKDPKLAILNEPLAAELGLDVELLKSSEGVEMLAGNRLPPGSEPLAQAYAGHQFGNFTMLGDGRAILLGEQITPQGKRFDVQLKGPGPTVFSRRGDGRAALGPMLREYVVSEAMFALGIPTTRSLAVTLTGEEVYRQEVLPGAILTRIAASHIRVGTFEWAAARGGRTAVKALADYAIKRHYPEVEGYGEFFRAVVERQAALIARWQVVGFIHGVMNTDNMSICGETIDYGPCAFMDEYDPATVFSSIDQRGRYAYGNQPMIAQWNLARLAEALLTLFDDDEQKAVELANGLVVAFKDRFQHHWLAGMRRKLGLFNEEPEDEALVQALLDWMRHAGGDFTNTFRELSGGPAHEAEGRQDWKRRWMERRGRQHQSLEESVALMKANNPVVIPRNHRVEEALKAAETRGDFSVLQRLLEVLAKPFDDDEGNHAYRGPGGPDMRDYQTFCGT